MPINELINCPTAINRFVVHEAATSDYSITAKELQQMYLQNKYTRIYNIIIERAKSRKITGYTEKHHIIPKSLGGSNDKENLVFLTAREHFICHRLLPKMLEGESKRKMVFAAWSMTIVNNKNHNRQYKISSRTYEHLKRERSEQLRNVPLSEEHVAKLKKARAKQVFLEETKKKISKSLKGYKQSEETKRKRAESLRGQTRTEEQRQRQSEAAKKRWLNQDPIAEEKRRTKLREARAKQVIITKQVTCPHCGKTGGNRIMPRYHFDNCKKKGIQ